MATTEPQKWAATLGSTADVNTIPATTPSGSGRASFSGLFPPVTQLPLDQGGIAPERGDFNALFKYLGELYLCIASNGPGSAIKYPTDAAYWRQLALTSQLPIVNNGTLTIQRDGATVATFTANQAGNTIANIAISEIHSQSAGFDSQGTGWVRFKSGLQIVFGIGLADTVVNYPVAFIADPRLVMTSPTSYGYYVGVPGWYERTTTYFKGNVYDPVDHEFISGGHFEFIAIGFWK